MSDMFSSDVTVEPGSNPIPITGTVTDNQGTPNTLGNAWPVSVTDGTNILGTPAHPLNTTGLPVTSNSATVTSVALVANTNTTLLAANANRKGALIFVPKGTTYLKFGATASATSFTYAVTTNNTQIVIPSTWVGQIDIISNTAQSVIVTEMV